MQQLDGDQISDQVTDAILEIPPLILEDLVHSLHFCFTAACFAYGEKIPEAENSFMKRYISRPDLLQSDLGDGKRVARRLRRFIQETPEDSTTHSFALKYLPQVEGFNKILSDYAEKNR